jgi:hypothetical protein
MVLLYIPLKVAGNLPKHVGELVIFNAVGIYNELQVFKMYSI